MQLATENGSRPDHEGCARRAVRLERPLAPVGILDSAVAGRSVIQDFRPLRESLEWELGLRYYQNQGSGAFLHDATPIPYAVNNDGNFAAAAAKLLFETLSRSKAENEQRGEILVLEIGIGLGLFARFFLDCFCELCRDAGKNYYDRVCCIAGDFSERMLADLCKHGVLAAHAGHYRLRIVDATDPIPSLMQDDAFAARRTAPDGRLSQLPARCAAGGRAPN